MATESLTGQIKSYSTIKRYGFIKGADNTDYFFHKSNVTGDYIPKIGQRVSFTEHPTPKGMQAVKIQLNTEFEKTFSVTHFPDGVQIRKDKANFGKSREVVYVHQPMYAESKSPDEAIAYMKSQAANIGCNALIGLSRDRRTGTSATNFNYKYTIHCFKATPALICDVKYTDNKEMVESNRVFIKELTDTMKTKHINDLVIKGSSILAMLFLIGLGFLGIILFLTKS